MKAFNEFAAEAAQMENQGQVKEAATAWRRAGAYCEKEQNREWCNARAGFCESRFAMASKVQAETEVLLLICKELAK